MGSLDNKTSQVEFDNINLLILAGIATNKTEIFQLNGYGTISINDRPANIFYIVFFLSFPYTLQEDVKSDGNRLASGDLV